MKSNKTILSLTCALLLAAASVASAAPLQEKNLDDAGIAPSASTSSDSSTKTSEFGKEETKCKLKFELESWSLFYKSGKGQGQVTCDNGQSAEVAIRAVGAGVTFGKTRINNASGTFSQVKDISEVFGGYASSEAHAGVVGSAKAEAMTKGTVSLALTGTGKGFDLGIAFGKFKISPLSELGTRSAMKEKSIK